MISCKTEIWKNVLNFSDDLSDNKQGLKQPSSRERKTLADNRI